MSNKKELPFDEDRLYKLINLLNSNNILESQSTISSVVAIGEAAVLPLLEYCVKPSYDGISSIVLEILTTIGKSSVTPILINALEQSDEILVWHASYVLSFLGDVQAIKPLIKTIEKFSSGAGNSRFSRDIYRTCIYALTKIGKPALPPLLHLYKVTIDDVRAEIIKVLSEFNSVEAYDTIFEALKNSNNDIRQGAVRSLGAMGDPKDFEVVLNALGDSHKNVRWSAAGALGKLGDKRAITPLLIALNDTDNILRESAIKALESFQDKRITKALIDALKDSHPNVRSLATQQLGIRGDKKALDALIQTLNDNSSVVRYYGAVVLGKFKDKRAIKFLEQTSISDPDVEVRQEALNAIEKINQS